MERNLVFFWATVGIIYSILFVVEYSFWGYKMTIMEEEVQNLGKIILYAQILYTLASLRIVWATELGMRLLFGRPTNLLSHGLAFIPLGFCQLSKETRLTVEDELPADPEHIHRVKLGEPEVVPPELRKLGYVPPIRVTFGYPNKDSGIPTDDPLNERITAEVVIIIRWRIANFGEFLTTIGSRRESRRQLQDIAVSTLFPLFAKVTPAEVLKNLGEYNRALEEGVRLLMAGKITSGGQTVNDEDARPWGTVLANAQVKEIGFGHELNKSIEGVPKAKLEKAAIIHLAKADKEKRRLAGEGDGSAEEATLRGRTAGLLTMSKSLGVSGASVLGAETARGITDNPGQKTIVAGVGGIKELVAVATTVGEALKPTDKEE